MVSTFQRIHFCLLRVSDKISPIFALSEAQGAQALKQGLYRDVKTSSGKELKFRMKVKQSQILTVQYVNSRQHAGK